MQKRILCYAIACLFSVTALSQTTVTLIQDKPIWDLRLENATNMSASDDGTSQVFNFGFDFNFFGETFNQGYMASNGCLILGSLSTASTWEKNCTQYNPSPSPNTNYTIYPFWTDLIMGENSSMLAKSFDDKVIFGWYEMWEYYRDSKNTFELWLYPNDTYEARYGELDIQDHDVFIGIQGKEDEFETYYFHDECNTGEYNSKECYNYDWNNSDKNQNLENGGSLFVGEVIDCSNPLNDVSCAGYWQAYDDEQCDIDPQYSPSCKGYKQEESVAYFQEEEIDYGYQEEQNYSNPPIEEEQQFGYIEEPMQSYEEPIFFEPQQQVFNEPQPFSEPIETIEIFEIAQEETFLPREEIMIEEFIFQETFLAENLPEPERIIEEEPEPIFEEVIEEELEPRFIEEEIEEQVAEVREERERQEETIEEIFVENKDTKSSLTRDVALRVVSSTIKTANNSVSGTSQNDDNNLNNSSNSSGSSGGGVSMSNSPSISDQFASSTAQNNEVLQMSVSVSTESNESFSDTTTMASNISNTSSVNNDVQIDTSLSANNSRSDSDEIADQILAKNMQEAQNEIKNKQEQTGEYGSEDKIIAYMGYVVGFNDYRALSIPNQELWYKSKNIYTSNTLLDNRTAFNGLFNQNIKTLVNLKAMQPNL